MPSLLTELLPKYWNWFKYQDDLAKSPVFDGSDTSLSGDGEFFPHNGSMAANRTIYLPSGKGGGCVKSGPFKKLVSPLSFPPVHFLAPRGAYG